MNFSISPIVFSICGSVFILVCVLLMQALLHLTIYDLKVLHKQDKLNITRLKNQFYYRIILFLGVLFVISLCFSLLIYVLFPLGLAVQILYLSGKVYPYEKTKGFEFMQFDKTHEQIMFYLIFQLLVSTLMVYFFFDPSLVGIMFNTSKKFNFLKILGKYFGTVTAAVRDFVRKGVEAGTKADVPKLVVESTIQGVSWNVIVASSAAAWTAAKYVSDNAGPYYNANIKGKLGPLVRHLYNNMTPPNMGSNPSPVAVHRLIRQLEQERFTAFESAIRRHHAMLNKLSHEPIIRQPLMADLDPVDQAVAAEIVYNALVDDIIRGVVVEALLVAPDVLNVIVP